MVNKQFYNTILSQTISPCGNYLVVGDIYGKINVFFLSKIVNPDLGSTKPYTSPINTFTVREEVHVNSLLTTRNHLIVGTVREISGYDWSNVKKGSSDVKPAWRYELPNVTDAFNRVDVNCLVLKGDPELLYAGCGDNNVYVFNLETGMIVRTMTGHTDYIHSIFTIGNEFISGGEDGLVNIWDLRHKKAVNKLEPYKNDSVARPELGKWIGAVSMNEDWLLCGGGPKLTLYHFRSLSASTIFPLEDDGIHFAEVTENRLLAGGRMDNFCTLDFNGDVISKIPTSCVTVYSVVHQDEPYKAVCIAGSSPKIDICSNFNYKDQVLSLM